MKNVTFGILGLTLTLLANITIADDTKEQLAEEYLMLSKTKDTFDLTTETYVQQLSDQNPTADSLKIRSFFEAYLGWEAIKEPAIRIVSNAFSEQELRDINDFYKSKSGESFANKSPEMAAELSKLIGINLQRALSSMSQ